MARKSTKSTAKKASPKKKSTPAFTFSLGWLGVASVTVVALCIFLWMFMLGVWAGQTVLLPPKENAAQSVSKPVKENGKQDKNLPVIEPISKKVPAQ